MLPTIRKYRIEEIPQIYKMILDFAEFQKTPEKVKITEAQMYEESGLFQCLVAVTASGEIVGFATYFYTYYSWSGKAIYLDDLFVKEIHRGRQIGSGLLQELIKEARLNKCKKLRWQVSKWNTKAIHFYKQLGADIDDTEINCDLVL